MPFAILESSLSNRLPLDVQSQAQVVSIQNPKREVSFPSCLCSEGKSRHSGKGHVEHRPCSAVVPECLRRIDASLRWIGLVFRLTFCNVGTWLFGPTCHPPSLFPKGA